MILYKTMKIVRLGMTETAILLLNFIYRHGRIDDQVKAQIYQCMLNQVNWLYTTSGYYDKEVKGSYFEFGESALTDNFMKYIKCLQSAVANCEETQMYFHEGFVQGLFDAFKPAFLKHYHIQNFKSMNGTKFYDRIDSVFAKMAGKKVLVVTSFDGLVKSQYDSGRVNKIYDKFPALAGLETVKSPYTFLNNGPDGNFFETLDALYGEIEGKDFDIAILGCGTYGHPLCDWIDSRLGKDAIYLGGSIQTIFGILSKRERECSNLPVDENWVTEIPEEYRAENYKMIENGCYW